MADIQNPIPSTASHFYLHPDALRITLNALGNDSLLSVSVYANAAVMAYCDGIIGYAPDKNYKIWRLTAFNTHFEDDQPRYCHIALSRANDSALVVYPTTRLDILGRPISDDGRSFLTDAADDSSPEVASAVPDEDPTSYYLFIGLITSPVNGQRQWSNLLPFNTGQLDTDQHRNEERNGQLEKMFELNEIFGWIEQKLPIRLSTIYNLALGYGRKILRDVFRIHDKDEDFTSVSTTEVFLDDVLPSEAHMRDYTDQNFLSKKKGGVVNGNVIFNNDVTVNGDTHLHDTTFGNDSVAGSHGAKIWQQDGSWHAQFDFLNITKKATFTELEIQEMSHIGGAFILSAASCTIDHVSVLDDGVAQFPLVLPIEFRAADDSHRVRCYFKATDGDRTISNDWKVGDQAVCKTFNIEKLTHADGTEYVGKEIANHYWWRKVLAVGTTDDGQYHYFDVSSELSGTGSNIDYDHGSDLPMAGDKCMLLGHQPVSEEDRIANIKRGNAIIIDSCGEGSPYYRSYKRIGFRNNPYSLEGCMRINLEAENPTLDVSSLTITTTAGDGTERTQNVGDALTDHFNIYSLDIAADIDPRKEPGDPGYFIDPALGDEGWPDYEDYWQEDEYPSHVNDVAICTNSAYFRFQRNDDGSYGWHNITDQVLIDAIRKAQEALTRLTDMADDNKITPEEKSQLRQRLVQIQQESEQIIQEASYYEVSATNMAKAYRSLKSFIEYILSDSGTTELVRDADGYVLGQISMKFAGSDEIYEYRYFNNAGGAQIFVTYSEVVRIYYTRLAALRAQITMAVRNYVENMSFGQDSVSQAVAQNVNQLWTAFSDWCTRTHEDGTPYRRNLIDLDSDVIALTAWARNGTADIGSGFVTESKYTSMFSTAKDPATGKTLAQSLAATYVNFNYETDEDGNVIFDENGEPAGRWISGFKIEADEIVIHTDNFTVERNGDVTVYGELDVKSMKQKFLDVTQLYALRADGFEIEALYIRDLRYSDRWQGAAYDSDGRPVSSPRGYYNLLCTGRNIIMPRESSFIGQRVVLYNNFDGQKPSLHFTTIVINSSLNNGDIHEIPFRGIAGGLRFMNTLDMAQLNDYKKVKEIDFANGIIELLGVPETDGTCGWAVINVGTKVGLIINTDKTQELI